MAILNRVRVRSALGARVAHPPVPGGRRRQRKAKQFHEELRDVLTEVKETVETLTNSL
ncbi:MAG: hypothetical protein V3U30_02305 [Thermoplasmata archaeon]